MILSSKDDNLGENAPFLQIYLAIESMSCNKARSRKFNEKISVYEVLDRLLTYL